MLCLLKCIILQQKKKKYWIMFIAEMKSFNKKISVNIICYDQ